MPPITFGTPTNGDSASPITTVTVTMPGSITVGCKIRAVLEITGGSGTTITVPDGTWSLISRASNNDGNVISTAVYERTGTGTEAGTYAWTLSASSNNTSWQAFAFYGQAPSYQTGGTPTTTIGNTTVGPSNIGQPFATGITTTVDNVTAIAYLGGASSSLTINTPAGWTNLSGGQNSGRSWRICYLVKSPAGATGDATGSNFTTGNRYWACVMEGVAPTIDVVPLPATRRNGWPALITM
jgi:hypothetical protein